MLCPDIEALGVAMLVFVVLAARAVDDEVMVPRGIERRSIPMKLLKGDSSLE